MPAPANTSALTAIAIASLPYSVTQQADDAGTTYDLWYSYLAQTGDNVIGIFGLGDLAVYMPTTTVWLGPASAPVAYMSGIGAVNKPFQIQVTPGTTYYFRIRPNGGNPTPAILTLDVQASVDQTVPIGSIAINDDTDGFPLAILDAANDNTVLRFLQGIAAGEGGDILPDGTLLLEDISAPNQLKLYDANYVTLATIAAAECNVVSSNKTDRFYIGRTTSGITPATVRTVDAISGALGATTYTLTGTISLQGLAPSPDESILYYFRGGGNNLPIKRWDLVNNVALADLVAGVGVGWALQKDLLCLDDGSIIVQVRNTGTTTQECRRYSAAGALLNTYTLTYGLSSTGGDRMAYGVDDTSFWVQQKGNPEQIGTISEIRVSDGVVLTTHTYRYFETGAYQGAATLTPDARFGPSFSCPFWVTRVAYPSTPSVTPGGTPNYDEIPEQIIVCERTTPIISDENVNIRHDEIELDLIVGESAVDATDAELTVQMQYSDNSGRTWSSWLRGQLMGAAGDYSRRVRWSRLGTARNRVYRVRVAANGPVTLINAYGQFQRGAF